MCVKTGIYTLTWKPHSQHALVSLKLYVCQWCWLRARLPRATRTCWTASSPSPGRMHGWGIGIQIPCRRVTKTGWHAEMCEHPHTQTHKHAKCAVTVWLTYMHSSFCFPRTGSGWFCPTDRSLYHISLLNTPSYKQTKSVLLMKEAVMLCSLFISSHIIAMNLNVCGHTAKKRQSDISVGNSHHVPAWHSPTCPAVVFPSEESNISLHTL